MEINSGKIKKSIKENQYALLFKIEGLEEEEKSEPIFVSLVDDKPIPRGSLVLTYHGSYWGVKIQIEGRILSESSVFTDSDLEISSNLFWRKQIPHFDKSKKEFPSLAKQWDISCLWKPEYSSLPITEYLIKRENIIKIIFSFPEQC